MRQRLKSKRVKHRTKVRNPYVAPSRFRKAGAHEDRRRQLQERAARKDREE